MAPNVKQSNWEETSPEGDDRVLLERVRGGDAVAFEAMVRRYFDALYRFAYRSLRSREGAEEILQETFWWVWEHRAGLEMRESLRSYLYRAVRNRMTDLVRHQRVEQAYADRVTRAAAGEVDEEGAVGGSGAAAPDPLAECEAREFAEALAMAVSRLPARTREAYVLYQQEGLRYAEVAEAMQISVKGVEFHLAKALRLLREALQRFAP